MRNYKIIYTETLRHEFHLQANSKKEAEAEFNRLNNAGAYDYSCGEIVNTSIEVVQERHEHERLSTCSRI